MPHALNKNSAIVNAGIARRAVKSRFKSKKKEKKYVRAEFLKRNLHTNVAKDEPLGLCEGERKEHNN